MIYLLALNGLFLIAVVKLWMLVNARSDGIEVTSREVRLVGSGLMVAMVAGIPLLMALSEEQGMAPVSGWATLGGGVLGMLVYGLAFKYESSGRLGRKCVSAAAVATSAYMSFVALDHLAFYGFGSSTDAGMLNWEATKAELNARDVDCDKGILLVANVDQVEAAYRCPTTLVLGKFSAMPFAPWPSYESGKSVDLASGIRGMQEDARRNSR